MCETQGGVKLSTLPPLQNRAWEDTYAIVYLHNYTLCTIPLSQGGHILLNFLCCAGIYSTVDIWLIPHFFVQKQLKKFCAIESWWPINIVDEQLNFETQTIEVPLLQE